MQGVQINYSVKPSLTLLGLESSSAVRSHSLRLDQPSQLLEPGGCGWRGLSEFSRGGCPVPAVPHACVAPVSNAAGHRGQCCVEERGQHPREGWALLTTAGLQKSTEDHVVSGQSVRNHRERQEGLGKATYTHTEARAVHSIFIHDI